MGPEEMSLTGGYEWIDEYSPAGLVRAVHHTVGSKKKKKKKKAAGCLLVGSGGGQCLHHHDHDHDHDGHFDCHHDHDHDHDHFSCDRVFGPTIPLEAMGIGTGKHSQDDHSHERNNERKRECEHDEPRADLFHTGTSQPASQA